jgi:hypothetical protein
VNLHNSFFSKITNTYKKVNSCRGGEKKERMTTPLRIYSLPVSGGHFPVQIGFLTAIWSAYEVLKIKHPDKYSGPEEKPHIVLASSGGNIVSYYGLASDWARAKLYSIVDHMRSDAFIESWTEFVPSWIFLPFAKSLYRPGYGFKEIFSRWFTPAILRSGPEIWTGVCENEKHRHRLFTNKAEGKTLIVPRNIVGIGGKNQQSEKQVQLCTNEPTIYMNGNIEMAAQVTLASASIPMLAKPVFLNDSEYTDGGSMFASPIGVLKEEVADLGKTRTLRLFYLSSTSVTKDTKSSVDIIGFISDFVRSIRSNDMRAFISIITTLGGDFYNPEHYEYLNPESFADLIFDLDATNKHYAIILYPEFVCEPLDLTHLNPVDIRRMIGLTENTYSAFVWRT